MDDTTQAVRRGVDEALGAGIATTRAPLVAVISRRHGLEAAWEVVRHIAADAGDCYVGVDFASDELRHRTAAFVEVARAVAGLGLPLTVHTGEGVGADHIADILELPGVRRLGHAVSLPEDPALLAAIRDRELVVEICPTSNLRTGIVRSYAEHPARALLAAGLRVVLCSDNPALFAVDLSHELAVARDEMGFSDADLERCQGWAHEAAFGPS
jgi:adenosine deaminase